jgi:signal peptidase I
MIKAVKLEGSSMLPLFKPGEIVLIEDNSGDTQGTGRKLCPGDCVVYSFEGRNLLHRVIAVDDSGPLISDDAGLIPPHKVPWRNIAGRVMTGNPLKKGICGLICSKFSKLRRVKDK